MPWTLDDNGRRVYRAWTKAEQSEGSSAPRGCKTCRVEERAEFEAYCGPMDEDASWADSCGGWTFDPPCGGCSQCIWAQITYYREKEVKLDRAAIQSGLRWGTWLGGVHIELTWEQRQLPREFGPAWHDETHHLFEERPDRPVSAGGTGRGS